MSRSRSSPVEIPEDRGFQTRFWRAERIAWAGFALVLFAALSGLLGSGGFLARATSSLGASLVEYPRFARWEAGDELHVRVAGGAQRSLVLPEAFSAAFEVTDTQPTPLRVIASTEGHTYLFAAEGDGPIDVRFALTPRKAGLARYSLGFADGSALRAWSFIWP